MDEPTRIIVLPNGTVLVAVGSEGALERWREALFQTWQTADGQRAVVTIEREPIVVTDLRRGPLS